MRNLNFLVHLIVHDHLMLFIVNMNVSGVDGNLPVISKDIRHLFQGDPAAFWNDEVNPNNANRGDDDENLRRQ